MFVIFSSLPSVAGRLSKLNLSRKQHDPFVRSNVHSEMLQRARASSDDDFITQESLLCDFSLLANVRLFFLHGSVFLSCLVMV